MIKSRVSKFTSTSQIILNLSLSRKYTIQTVHPVSKLPTPHQEGPGQGSRFVTAPDPVVTPPFSRADQSSPATLVCSLLGAVYLSKESGTHLNPLSLVYIYLFSNRRHRGAVPGILLP